MTTAELQLLVRDIAKQACELKDKHTNQQGVPVHYVAIFAQDKEGYESLINEIEQIGSILKDTSTGPLYKVKAIDTVAGPLRIIKIRTPDTTRPELGDADFAAKDYQEFKDSYLSHPGFKLIKREDFEMIELMDPQFGVRVYFSHPPLDEQLGIR